MLDWVAISFPGEPGSCSDGLGHDQYIFNPIFLLMGGPMFPPYYLVGPNYSGGNEDNGELLQKIPCMYRYTHCPQAFSRPPTTQASTGDSWTLLEKSGSVSLGGHCSFLLGPGAHKVLFVPSKSLFPSPV